ncbi:MAG: HIRAN domain-containing protein [Firmicutes bacterium]|nr:HIRAN domain-containing protein [Bacillota bacterium]
MNDLTIKSEHMLDIIENNDLSNLIQPLIKEIYLFDSYIAGTTHLKEPSVLESLEINQKLNLVRENNKFDENAILIQTEEGIKCGYIPERDNIVFSRLMDAGKLLIARIKEINKKHNFYQIKIQIYLIDF